MKQPSTALLNMLSAFLSLSFIINFSASDKSFIRLNKSIDATVTATPLAESNSSDAANKGGLGSLMKYLQNDGINENMMRLGDASNGSIFTQQVSSNSNIHLKILTTYFPHMAIMESPLPTTTAFIGKPSPLLVSNFREKGHGIVIRVNRESILLGELVKLNKDIQDPDFLVKSAFVKVSVPRLSLCASPISSYLDQNIGDGHEFTNTNSMTFDSSNFSTGKIRYGSLSGNQYHNHNHDSDMDPHFQEIPRKESNDEMDNHIIKAFIVNYYDLRKPCPISELELSEDLSLEENAYCDERNGNIWSLEGQEIVTHNKKDDDEIGSTKDSQELRIAIKENKYVNLSYHCVQEEISGGRDIVVIDAFPLFTLWLKMDSRFCPNRNKDLGTLVFALMIDADADLPKPRGRSNEDAQDSGRGHHNPSKWDKEGGNGRETGNFTQGFVGDFLLQYFLDRRCTVPYPIPENRDQNDEAMNTEEDPMFHEIPGNETGYDPDVTCRLRDYCVPTNTCRVWCDFEGPCPWKWNIPRKGETGFRKMTAAQVLAKIKEIGEWSFLGPLHDANNKTDGHFLILAFENGTKPQTHYQLTSPWFQGSSSGCNLQAMVHMHKMDTVALRMVISTRNHSSYVPMSIKGNTRNLWEKLKQMVGFQSQEFQITLEVDDHIGIPSHFALDDIRLVDCFPSARPCNATCRERDFQCNDGTCINRNQICDLNKDCLFGEDEDQGCDKMPENTTCTFEDGWCGWTNVKMQNSNISWDRTKLKSQYTEKTGPRFDHTFKNTSGHLLLVNMVRGSSYEQAVLRSPIFARPPTYNQNRSSPFYESCQLHFFYHMYGAHVGSLDVELVLKNPRNSNENKPIRFCERTGENGNLWQRASCKLPQIKGSKKYYIQFRATRGYRGAVGDIGIDDISLSPECVGLGVPASELVGYNYTEILNSSDDYPTNLSAVYRFTTCNNTGRLGPTAEQCVAAYNGSTVLNHMSMDPSRPGVQVWTVPETRHYTLIAKGARGGRGAIVNQVTSHGSIVRVTVYLRKGERIYVLVGQEGTSVCDQSTGQSLEMDLICKGGNSDKFAALSLIARSRKQQRQVVSPTSKPRPSDDPIAKLSSFNKLAGGAGGGGGATFVYKMNGNILIPILVAAGGGGLGYNASGTISPNGKGLNVSIHQQSGSTQSWGAGGGGGWDGPLIKNNNTLDPNISFNARFRTPQEFQNDSTKWVSGGSSLVDEGGIGGRPCSASESRGLLASGGFGGGGGGCTAGGGGAGWRGGSAHVSVSANGEGGWSFISKGGMYPGVEAGVHGGPGEFVAIPSFFGCGCQQFCVHLDDFELHSACVCQENWILSEDGVSCLGRYDVPVIAIIIASIVVFFITGLVCFCLYNRYQRQKVSMLRRKVMGGPELQLSRLRAQAGPGGVLTEYNPNYEFGGETYTLTDLKEIPRDNLRLVKALGQGAFGEVYQGFYRHRDGDAVEMPVAVKTLPELSSNQAEMDFLMEALIMSKFNHPNIVHFIGVCFDKHPRFIILELLAGGDLKTFLRESRPKPDRGSPLAMRDLLLCAVDIAKGCKYLEDNHFIHRDIAARNCLLTTKGPGRVVKIADFGMARDIYRADYYKKGGKAMLPVKWMPPEAFLDGIFTSKTDAWSYGVLLWEIFSLGYMPYPGRGNQDVMQLVTNGGRLEAPSNCPTPVYGIMTQCWHPIPEERPTFSTIIERLGYCIQDPEVVNAPLPIFQRPPSSERDATLMRPLTSDDASCLRIVHGQYSRNSHHSSSSVAGDSQPMSPSTSTADYLIPTPLSNPTTPTGRTDSVTSPSSDIPESHSTETILDDEDEGVKVVRGRGSKMGNPRAGSSSSAVTNGIDNGITLNPSSLNINVTVNPTSDIPFNRKAGSNNSNKKAVSYVEIESRRKNDTTSDEEIRC